ncbi:MAG: hypothetical protein H6622_06455 [Halobacteriovoraceae bacterium]|nr:hypothetical protein [Halobacteriovoraceae bacterium]
MIKYFFFTNIIILNFAFAYNSTPKYWNCKNKNFGSWNFGNFAESCDVDTLLDEQITFNIYSPLIYFENEYSQTERTRFMELMYSTLKDISHYYFLKRSPMATLQELEAWEKAVYSMSNQESFWSHYRKNGDKLQVMRGDYGHGHGIMQVDDRWHFDYVKDGRAWGLVPHFLFSLDMYYSAWQKSKTQWCVDSETNYESITRSAYSAYNGGMSSICRWTNPKHKWARNDINFWQKFQNTPWEKFILDFNRIVPIDIDCLANNKTNCRPKTPGGDLPQENSVYSQKNGNFCVFEGENFECINDEKFIGCFYDVFTIQKEKYDFKNMSEDFQKNYEFQNIDGHKYCERFARSIYSAGTFIKLQKNINLRQTPAGQIITVLEKSSTFQILDFFTMLSDSQKRYYRVRSGKYEGFIYAGNANDFSQWTIPSNKKTETFILQNKDYAVVKNPSGINVRDKVGGNVISYVPFGEQIEIINFFVLNKNNSVYYQLGDEYQNGLIYGGQVTPEFTLTNWVSPITQDDNQQKNISELKDQYFYAFLLDCSSQSCKKTYRYILGPASQKDFHQFYINEIQGTNAKIETVKGNLSGYLPLSMIKGY